jgi:hypothetical protein
MPAFPDPYFSKSTALKLYETYTTATDAPVYKASGAMLVSGIAPFLVTAVKLYEAYNTAADAPVYKNLVRFKGDHNHPRPAFFYSSVCCFFHQQLKLDQVLLGGNPVSHDFNHV